MDAIRLLKDDHKVVEQLFKRFEKAGDEAYTEKREIVDRIVEELSKHAAIEEQLFYPVVRATVPGTEDIALESLEEHHIVKWVLDELDSLDPRAERFDAKVTVLIENVRHHVEEEEQEFFPTVRKELGRNALNDLGDAMATAKQSAPTHPQPRSPDTPPGNLVAGTTAAMVDRLGDTVSGLAQGSVTAAGDLIAMILRRKRPSVAATGSKQARSTASSVRKGASSVTESAIEVVSGAKRTASTAAAGAKRTARTAKAGATRTARTAKAGTKSTATTAKAGATRTARTATSGTKSTAATAKAGATRTARTAKSGTKRTAATAKRTSTSTARTAAKRTSTTAKKAAGRTASTAKRAS